MTSADPVRLEDARALWKKARRAQGLMRGPSYPSLGTRRVLLHLREKGPNYGRGIGRATGMLPGNVSACMSQLYRLFFVDYEEGGPGVGRTPGRLGSGGGRPAKIWRLTPEGRRLADLISEESPHG